MNDPRWQRAMERLELVDQLDSTPNSKRYPDPSDPATFLRVVEALHLHGWLLEICYQATAVNGGNGEIAPFFYEAVMEAFGNDSVD